MMRKISIILCLLLSAALAVAVLKIMQTMNIQQKEKEDFQIIADLVEIPQLPDETSSTTTTQEDKEETKPTRNIAPVLKQNADCIGWIFIDGTNINYPVMQNLEIPNYYLRRGFDKNYDYYGIPYAAEHCNLATSDNVVIYGHHMNNGSMFSDLNKYLNQSFYADHALIQFDTLSEYGTYQIFSVFTISAYNEFAYHLFADAADQAEFDVYVGECLRRSWYDTGVKPVYGDRLLTLSTCEYSQANGRLVVVAKKIA